MNGNTITVISGNTTLPNPDATRVAAKTVVPGRDISGYASPVG